MLSQKHYKILVDKTSLMFVTSRGELTHNMHEAHLYSTSYTDAEILSAMDNPDAFEIFWVVQTLMTVCNEQD